MTSVSIIGCGYTGSRLALRYVALHVGIRGYGSRHSSLGRIAATGADAALLNLDGPMTVPLDLDGQLVYYTVPPAPEGERDPRLERLLAHIKGKPRRIVYLSTTGVYGDRGGAPVDEESPPQPISARAIRRLAAETTLRTWADAHSISWCVLRVPGIYGPGRLPIERLRRREPAIDPTEATPSNRIQVEDLVSACLAAGSAACGHRRVYNVTDGTDDSLTSYLERVARIAGLPPPPFISRADAENIFSAVSWSFLRESRRVANARMLGELAVTLRYEDLDAGIRASL